MEKNQALGWHSRPSFTAQLLDYLCAYQAFETAKHTPRLKFLICAKNLLQIQILAW